MNQPLPVPSPEQLAGDLRVTVGDLVRATRTADELGPVPAAVLDLLDRHGAMTTADLAARRGVRHQTMAATVKELTSARYVKAHPDPADARKKVLALTRAGKTAIDEDRGARVGLLARTIAGTLDDDERRVLAGALALIGRLTAAMADTGPPAASGRDLVTGAW